MADMTANGEVYDMESISAAHPTLPIPELCPRHQPRQQALHHRARQRSRPLSPGPADRRVGAHGKAAWLLRQRHRAGATSSIVGLASLAAPTTPGLRRGLRRGHARAGTIRGRGSASSRPFLPQFFDPAPAVRGPVPNASPIVRSNSATTRLPRGSPGQGPAAGSAAVTRQPMEPVVAAGEPEMAPSRAAKRLSLRLEAAAGALKPSSAPAARIPAAAARVEADVGLRVGGA